jgi:hypothetical protein
MEAGTLTITPLLVRFINLITIGGHDFWILMKRRKNKKQ